MSLRVFSASLLVCTIVLVNGCGTAASDSNASNNHAPSASQVSVTVDSAGAYVGYNLKGDYAYKDADQDPEGQTQFQWYRDDVAIDNATTRNYTLTKLDSGKSIRFEVTPVAAIGVAIGTAVRSDPITVNNSPPMVSNIKIVWDQNLSLLPVAGMTLTTTYLYRDADEDPEGSTVIQWYRDDTAIPDANQVSYTLTPDDDGKSISVTITPMAQTGAQQGQTINFVFPETLPVTLGGTVSGLAEGASLVLQNNGGDDLTIKGNGPFSFTSTIANNSHYSVTVVVPPSSPAQTCRVINASGTVTGTNITDVAVNCVTNAYTVTGKISGLSGGGLVLRNGITPLTLNGSNFSLTLPSGSGYAIVVDTQPSGPTQTCMVANGTGTVVASDISNVTVTCTTNSYAVSGSVSGLTGTGLALRNGTTPLTLNGSNFSITLSSGSTYDINVGTQPTGQLCSVNSGAGTITSGNVTVTVTCSTNSYSVGGSITGLTGSGLVLQNNSGDNLTVSAGSTSFIFATKVASNANYSVTVLTQPTNPSQTCTVTNATGAITNADVTSVTVTCVTNNYTIGGSISGLTASGLVLQNNNGDNLTVSANSTSFIFATKVASNAKYAVTILTQPTNPSQTCTVTSGSGTVTTASISNVAVSCTTNTYTVGGTVSGLAGTGLVLQNNSGDNLSVNANGTFTFTGKIPSNGSYQVTVLTQPSSLTQTCSVTNGAGTVTTADITNVAVSCVTNSYTVSAIVSGLAGSGLVLQNNSTDNLTVSANSTVTFTTKILSGGKYSVSVLTQPANPTQTCLVASGGGTITNANVTVNVNCTTNTYTVSGSVTGLNGSGFVLGNNNTPLTLSATNTFSVSLLSGTSYNIAVITPPSNPAQACSVSNGTGTVTNANITNITVSCVNVYTIGGTVSGLAVGASITLQDNGTDTLTIASNEPFAFPTALPDGTAYSVSILTLPANQPCTRTYGASTLKGANVANVNVFCGPAPSVSMNSGGGLATERAFHTEILLGNGKVLVVGGSTATAYLNSAELYDPATNSWSSVNPMANARNQHTATLLPPDTNHPEGQVLIAGGWDGAASLASAELYDPATNTWSAAADMIAARNNHTATLLPNGQVLVIGGYSTNVTVASAELYNPANDTWTPVTGPTTARASFTATLLPPDAAHFYGQVLVVGGYNGTNTAPTFTSSAELYDPAKGTWTSAGNISAACDHHTATYIPADAQHPNGQVLVAGGWTGFVSLANADIYDPAANKWLPAKSLNVAREAHTATRLLNGMILVAGGYSSTTGQLASAEIYDPQNDSWTVTTGLKTARDEYSATLLPNGQVLLAGGGDNGAILASTELYSYPGTWSATATMPIARSGHSATRLANGQILVAGGEDSNGVALDSCEIYDPSTNAWTPTGSLVTARVGQTATLLDNRKVLVAGGGAGTVSLLSAEIYDPGTMQWKQTTNMNTTHSGGTMTMLLNGSVLVTGGYDNTASTPRSDVEVYNPALDKWTTVTSLISARHDHAATLLPDGTVLVTGGFSASGAVSTSEIYDPDTNKWIAAGNMNTARALHTATLLPSGLVLIAGGYNTATLASSELYDPASKSFQLTGDLPTAHLLNTATLLPNGKVLVAGGFTTGPVASADVYDPTTKLWSATASLGSARYNFTATLLENGTLMVIGGIYQGVNYLNSAEIYR